MNFAALLKLEFSTSQGLYHISSPTLYDEYFLKAQKFLVGASNKRIVWSELIGVFLKPEIGHCVEVWVVVSSVVGSLVVGVSVVVEASVVVVASDVVVVVASGVVASVVVVVSVEVVASVVQGGFLKMSYFGGKTVS